MKKGTMRIQIASDLHLEFLDNRRFLKKNPLIPSGEILILAGDIMPVYLKERPEYLSFFKFCSDHFKWTYWIAGNHEFYGADMTGYTGSFVENILPNVQFVNNYHARIDGVDIILSTLWTKISTGKADQIRWQMNDYHKIRLDGKLFTPEDSNALFGQNLTFIENALKSPKQTKRLIVTHHVPTLRYYPAAYVNSPLMEAFAVDLDALVERPDIDFWVYGHHHHNIAEFSIGKTRMVTNQLGYIWLGENNGFRADLTII